MTYRYRRDRKQRVNLRPSPVLHHDGLTVAERVAMYDDHHNGEHDEHLEPRCRWCLREAAE